MKIRLVSRPSSFLEVSLGDYVTEQHAPLSPQASCGLDSRYKPWMLYSSLLGVYSFEGVLVRVNVNFLNFTVNPSDAPNNS